MFQWLQRQPCIKPQRLEPLRLWQVGFESRSLRLNCVTCNLWRGTSIVVSKVACSLGTQGGKPTSNAKYPLSDHPLRTQQVISLIHIEIKYHYWLHFQLWRKVFKDIGDILVQIRLVIRVKSSSEPIRLSKKP